MSARLDLLSALLEGQARIEAKLDRLLEFAEREPPARQADVDAAMAGLVRTTQAAVQHRVFTSAELAAHAEMPEAAELREAIVAAVGSLKPRHIGMALRALDGRDVEGLVVRRVGEDRDGANWMIERLRE
jgi:hypothetical protein